MRISKKKRKGDLSIKLSSEYFIIDKIDTLILLVVLFFTLYRYL